MSMKPVIQRMIADFHSAGPPKIFRRGLKAPLNLNRIITIIGPRRAGKTFYLYQMVWGLLKEGVDIRRILYLNFEDERLVFEDDAYDTIFDAYRELYPDQDLSKSYLFFDEIQELSNWEKFIRRVSDGISRHIFLTGSNAKMLSREIATSLRGRSLSFELFPLSFGEYLQFLNIPINDRFSSRGRAQIGNAFHAYCLWGGFPEVVTIEERFRAQVLQEYFHVMLFRDLVERYAIRDVSILKYLLKRLIGSFTREFSVNKLYNDLRSRGFSIGKDTLYQMMEALFSVYMLAGIEKFDPSVVRREMSNKKVFLYDHGYATAMHYSFSEDRGKRIENVVFRHFREQTEEIYFARNGWECDFVVFQEDRDPLLVQVTEHLDDSNRDREVKGLEAARRLTGSSNGLLLFDTVDPGVDLPGWIERVDIREWLLT